MELQPLENRILERISQSDISLEEKLQQILLFPIPSLVSDFAQELLGFLGTECIDALLFYGSKKNNSDIGRFSYLDYFVVLKDGTEWEFYKRLAAFRKKGSPQWRINLSTAFSFFIHHFLVPATYDLVVRGDDGKLVKASKICVVSRTRLEKELSVFSTDYHHRARFSQPMRLVFPKNNETLRKAANWQAQALRHVFDFIRPDLPFVFSVEQFVDLYLSTSYSIEVRPESQQKVRRIIQNEKHVLYPLYASMLNERIRSGELVNFSEKEPKYALKINKWLIGERIYSWMFRTRSKFNNYIRWWKNMMTFESWHDYVEEKVFNNIGYRLNITPRERKYWYILGWGKLTMYFVHKQRHERRIALQDSNENKEEL